MLSSQLAQSLKSYGHFLDLGPSSSLSVTWSPPCLIFRVEQVTQYINENGSPVSTTQQTRHTFPMFDQCWAIVVDGGPTLVRHWVDVSCFLGLFEPSNVCILGFKANIKELNICQSSLGSLMIFVPGTNED